VLRLFARHGGVVLAQRVLFGGSAADQQLSVMLTATGLRVRMRGDN
jgi:hypothetical protein